MFATAQVREGGASWQRAFFFGTTENLLLSAAQPTRNHLFGSQQSNWAVLNMKTCDRGLPSGNACVLEGVGGGGGMLFELE